MDHTGAAEIVQSCTIIPPRWRLGITYQCHRWRAVGLFWNPTQWHIFFAEYPSVGRRNYSFPP